MLLIPSHEPAAAVDTDTSPVVNDEFDVQPQASINASAVVKKDDLKGSLECPECGTVNQAANGVESFPKNLVLL